MDSSFEKNHSLPPVNLIVASSCGVGKSVLLESLFGKNVVEIYTGKYIDNLEEYQGDYIPIHALVTFDLEFFDGKRTAGTLNTIKQIASDKADFVWYCINSSYHKITWAEVDFITELAKLGVPFIIVMTQCITPKRNKEFMQAIKELLEEQGVSDAPFVQVLAKEYEIYNSVTGEVFVIPPKGLDELVTLTKDNLPHNLKTSFSNALKISNNPKE